MLTGKVSKALTRPVREAFAFLAGVTFCISELYARTN